MENKKDLADVPSTIKNIKIIPVKNVDEVLKVALTKSLKRVEWVEADQISKEQSKKKNSADTKPTNLYLEYYQLNILVIYYYFLKQDFLTRIFFLFINTIIVKCFINIVFYIIKF